MISDEEWEERIRLSRSRSLKVGKLGARVGVFCAGIEGGMLLGLSNVMVFILAIALSLLCEILYKKLY